MDGGKIKCDQPLDSCLLLLLNKEGEIMSAWTCHLLRSSPRYENWRKILQSDEAPIISPNPIKGEPSVGRFGIL